MALSQGIRARLEAQRLLLKEKLDQLGSKEPPSALNQDPETSSLPSAAGSAFVSEGGSGWGGGRGLLVSLTTCQSHSQTVGVVCFVSQVSGHALIVFVSIC